MTAKVMGFFFDLVMRPKVKRYFEDLDAPRQAQEKSLLRILRYNAKTAFGRNHDFAELAKLKNDELWKRFRETVPIAPYENFLPDIEIMKDGVKDILIPDKPLMFSLTSGTTSIPKLCPVNREFIKEHHSQHLHWMYKAYRDHPGINGGKYLVLASPAEMGRTQGGIPYGAMSGKQLESQSIPVRKRMASPPEVQRLVDSDKRWLNTILFAMAEQDLRVVTAVNPSTLVTIANKLAENAHELVERLDSGKIFADGGENVKLIRQIQSRFRARRARARQLKDILAAEGTLRPGTVWPNLQMLFTWQGGSASFYLPYVSAAWGHVPQRCLGLRASEGTFTIPHRDRDPSGALAVSGHVMEFVPAEIEGLRPDTPTLLAHELEPYKLYRMIITTSGGFYRYDLADLVQVTGTYRNTPEVAFIRRAGSTLSVTGEKVTEDQAVEAMRMVGINSILLNGFTLTWELDEGARYVLAVECAGGEKVFFQRRSQMTEQLQKLLAEFDSELRSRNYEYDAKRHDGRLGDPRLLLLADGTYRMHRSVCASQGSPENQYKTPYLVTPPAEGRAPVPGTPFFDHARVVAEITMPEE